MEAILTYIRDYGALIYLLLFAYCALKSGSLPLFGGYAAQAGALDVGLVAAAAFAGGYLGDEARFAVARRYGTGFLASKPRLNALMEKATLLLERYGVAYIFLYRYPKGMRTIGALPVGLTSRSWRSFTVLNGSSALLWTTVLVGAGYLFGTALDQVVTSGWGVTSFALLLLFAIATVFAWRRTSAMTNLAARP